MAVFSVPGKLERLGQVQGRFVQRQTMHRSPQIQDVALDTTIGLEALKDVLAQMDREGSLRVRGPTVHGAGTTALLATATQVREQAPMLENQLHGHMFSQECEGHLGPLG
jgi:hypothetical protein